MSVDIEADGGPWRRNGLGGGEKMSAAKSTQEAAERQARLKIGEVSTLSGVGVEALRFYERSGLLGRPGRTESGYRLYDPGVLDRLAFIKRAQVLGFTLDEIRHVIAEKESGRNPCAEVREIVRGRLRELDERMRQMHRYREELAATLSGWDEEGEAEGVVCGLIEGTTIKQEPPATGGLGEKKKIGRRSRGRS